MSAPNHGSSTSYKGAVMPASDTGYFGFHEISDKAGRASESAARACAKIANPSWE